MTTPGSRSRWAFLLAESVLIVASILLAFSIDAWWDGRQERTLKRELLRALRADFAATSLALDDAVAEATEDAARTGTYLAVVAGGREVSQDSLRWLFMGIADITFFEPILASYRTGVATGSLGLVRDPGLVEALTEFDRERDLYDLHLEISGDIFYLGSTQELRREAGGLLAPVAPPSSPTAPASFESRLTLPEDFDLRGALAVATVEPVYWVQLNILHHLQAMDGAAERVLAELDRVLE